MIIIKMLVSGGWHKKPYAEAQIVHYSQDGYAESNAGVWNQTVKSENTTYSAVTLGMSMEKKNADSDVELRAGFGDGEEELVNYSLSRCL